MQCLFSPRDQIVIVRVGGDENCNEQDESRIRSASNNSRHTSTRNRYVISTPFVQPGCAYPAPICTLVCTHLRCEPHSPRRHMYGLPGLELFAIPLLPRAPNFSQLKKLRIKIFKHHPPQLLLPRVRAKLEDADCTLPRTIAITFTSICR